MNYQETTAFLFEKLPQFESIGGKALNAKLDIIRDVCNRLDNPEKKIKTIHVAGTNGKGSVSAMLASIYKEAGYKTGLFISPHLVDFRERISISGKKISEQEVIEFVAKHQSKFNDLSPSFFEWTAALAFHHFAINQVDIAIIEVGLGGRLDATNIIEPELSIITSIGLDHTEFLGSSLSAIAREKAGIVKHRTPCIIGPMEQEAFKSIKEIAHNLNASLYQTTSSNLPCQLKGAYQNNNIGIVEKAIEIMQNSLLVEKKHIEQGLLKISLNTPLRGRWEILSHEPTIIADIGHNEAAFKILGAELYNIKPQLHIVFGMVNDKDVEAVVKYLPKQATYYLCCPKIKRGLPIEKLANYFTNGYNFKLNQSVTEAFESAKSLASKQDTIYVGGSNFVVAEIIEKYF